ncbi:dihydroceramide fatty acyl 2-hydroxylase FAH2 isoform X1 [Bradysia coprophila]|uniref:dihydroceramide fatty acyl 2-hydroxylase FAH2 isoform X1 n=2 Tax=Bradysia coprophila TaxID=38358 RepID=UPI00187DA54F|nr:dihydroceramide fatty acyl 2-hydroxylase FAH2 isoform X1 [Bradysia coprophila]XP_037033237.1 dihydroceramide fatty acyl 2-hydroxylase FAH2 isoform X1 [Bradysia coprophila]
MEESPLVISYKQKRYDLTQFQHKHPGGLNTLKGLNNQDIEQRFEKAPPHSDAALYLMKEYELKNAKEANNNNTGSSNGFLKNGISNGHSNGIGNGSVHTENVNGSIPHKTDESMEHLVDWSKPMLSQIGSLKENYSEWVNKPVDRPLRLFGPTWLENLTKTPWWLVPLFWIPSIGYIASIGLKEAYAAGFSSSYVLLSFIAGIALWTILEYSLHRWVFHLNAENGGVFLCTFHFLLHGLHHKVPFDPYRLVFPPVPATILATLFYQPLPLLASCPKIVLAGGLVGYLCYDMIHYYIHYGSPTFNYMYMLKRYHYQHHFVHHDAGFGISSPIWDVVFGTKIFLRKLKYMLRW